MKQYKIVIRIDNNSQFPMKSMERLERIFADACKDNDSKIRYYRVDAVEEEVEELVRKEREERRRIGI